MGLYYNALCNFLFLTLYHGRRSPHFFPGQRRTIPWLARLSYHSSVTRLFGCFQCFAAPESPAEAPSCAWTTTLVHCLSGGTQRAGHWASGNTSQNLAAPSFSEQCSSKLFFRSGRGCCQSCEFLPISLVKTLYLNMHFSNSL